MLKIRAPKIGVDPQNWPFFYGWVILFVGTLGILLTIPGQTIGVSTFTDSLLVVLKLSRDELSIAYMFGTMLSALLLTQAGKFFDRFGALRTALIASIGLGISLLYLSQLDRINRVFGSPKVLVSFQPEVPDMAESLSFFACERAGSQKYITNHEHCVRGTSIRIVWAPSRTLI